MSDLSASNGPRFRCFTILCYLKLLLLLFLFIITMLFNITKQYVLNVVSNIYDDPKKNLIISCPAAK